MYIVDITSPLYRTPAGLPGMPYFFGPLVIPCPIQHYLPTACLCMLAHDEARRRLPKEGRFCVCLEVQYATGCIGTGLLEFPGRP